MPTEQMTYLILTFDALRNGYGVIRECWTILKEMIY